MTQPSVEGDPAAATSSRISVVIPTYNRVERCRRLLRLLADQTLSAAAFEVIVVDDCSPDGTFAALQSLVPDVPYRLRLMQAANNAGAGPARNIGWQAADAPIIAFIDDDVVPDPGWLAAGLEVMDADPRIGVVQGRTNCSDPDALNATRWAHSVIVFGPTPYFESCNIFYRRQAIQDAGGFGVEYTRWSSPAWGEDTLAGWSAIEAGWHSGYADDAIVTHDVEYRTLKWWLKTSLSQYREVALAQRFPEFRRRAFWRPWAPRQTDAAFALSALGLMIATRWRPAALAAVPYLVVGRPQMKQGDFLKGCLETVLVDSARAAGNLYGSAKSRTLVV